MESSSDLSKHTSNNSEDNFLLAFAELVPPREPIFEYRVYYDPITRACLFTTIDKPDGVFITLPSRTEYDSIDVCSMHSITNSGKLIKRSVDFTATKMLQLSKHGAATIRDCNIFAVDLNYAHAKDFWQLRTLNE